MDAPAGSPASPQRANDDGSDSELEAPFVPEIAVATALKTCLGRRAQEGVNAQNQDTDGTEDDITARQLLLELSDAEASDAGGAGGAEEEEEHGEVDEAAQAQAQRQRERDQARQQQQQQARQQQQEQEQARRQQQQRRRRRAASLHEVQRPAAGKRLLSQRSRIIYDSDTDGEADAENSPAVANGVRDSGRGLQQRRAEEQQLQELKCKFAQLKRQAKPGLAKKQRHDALDLLSLTLQLAELQVGHLEERSSTYRSGSESGEASADEAAAQRGTAAVGSPAAPGRRPYAVITAEWELQPPIHDLSREQLMREGCTEKPEGSRGCLLVERPDGSFRRLSVDFCMRYWDEEGMLHAVPDVKTREDFSTARAFVNVGEEECNALLHLGEEVHVTSNNKNLTTVAELAEIGLCGYKKRIQRNSVLVLVEQLALQAKTKGQGIREPAAGGKAKLVGSMSAVHSVAFCGMEGGSQPQEPLAFVARPSSQSSNIGMPVLRVAALESSSVRCDLRNALMGLQCRAPLAEAALYSAVEHMVVEQDGHSVWDAMKEKFKIMVASFNFYGTLADGTPALVERDLLLHLHEPTPAARALLAQQALTKAQRDALGATATLEWSEPRVASAQLAAEAVGKLAAAITTDPAREGADPTKKAAFK